IGRLGGRDDGDVVLLVDVRQIAEPLFVELARRRDEALVARRGREARERRGERRRVGGLDGAQRDPATVGQLVLFAEPGSEAHARSLPEPRPRATVSWTAGGRSGR